MVTRLQRSKLFAKLLLGAVIIGVGGNAGAQGISFNSPLVDAANNGDEASVLLMLSQGYGVNSQGEYGVTPLMRAAYNGHLRIVKVLLGMGADVNATDIAGATALHLAARMGRQDVAEELLRYRANVDAADQEGWTPLMRAALAKNPAIVRLLLDNGADPFKVNSAGEYVLMQAVEVSSPEVVQVLVEKGVVTRDNPAVIAALGAAVRKDNPQVTNTLQAALTQPLPNTAAPVEPVMVTKLPETNRPIAEQVVDSIEQPVAAPLPNSTPAPMVSATPAFAAFEEVKPLEEVIAEENRIKLLKEKAKKANFALLEQQNAPQAPAAVIVQPTMPAKTDKPQQKEAQAKQPQPNAEANASPVSNKRFFRLQAGMYDNQEAAKTAWDVFTTTYPKIFSGQKNAIMALPNQTQTYTLVFGQFASRQSANKLCNNLWQKDIGCYVMETSLTLGQLEKAVPPRMDQVAQIPATEPAAPFNVANAIQEEKIQEEVVVQSGKPALPPLPEGATLIDGMPWLQEEPPVTAALPAPSTIHAQSVVASGETMAMREEMQPAPQKKSVKAKEKLQPEPSPKQVATKAEIPKAKAGPVKKGTVEIAEAIRVQPGQKITLPKTTKETPATPRHTAKASPTPATPAPVPATAPENTPNTDKPKLIAVKAPPKAAITGNIERYWIQVGNFANQQTAVEFAKVIRQNPNFRGARLRVVRLPAAAAKNEPAIALQLGSFASERKAKNLCKEGLSYLRCLVIKEVQPETNG